LKKKTIGIIGAGKHFKNRIYPILSKSNFFEIKGILKRNKNNFKKIKKFNEEDFFKQHFDFVYIACPNRFHENYIIKSLKVGCHVICEKPFIIKKKNINKIIKLSKSKKKLIFEAFMYVYHPVFEYVKNIVKQKKYGKMQYIIANQRYPSLDKNNNRYKKNEGDGFFFDAAVYLLSLENYLFNNKINKFSPSSSQKIKNIVDLRGNIYINSPEGKRFYFWGEGQNYTNSLEIFFDKASIYVNKFFSKKDDEDIYVKIYSKINKQKIIKKSNQFKKMFDVIQKNYDKKKFQQEHINNIVKQLSLLTKYNL
tara:strand:+ start:1357 stop:2283 length:927 start_codon:yes stop_codon:yes gene_type:complete